MVFDNWADYMILGWAVGLIIVYGAMASFGSKPGERGSNYARMVGVSFWLWLIYMAGSFS